MNFKYAKYYIKVLLENWFKSKKSYAQHGEDELANMLFDGGIKSFIDVGANDGVLFSNTYKFAKLGARGVCFEPSMHCYQKLILNHLWNPKIKCIRMAITDKKGKIFFEEDGYENVLSKVSFNPSKTSSLVKANSLDKVISRFKALQNPDLVSIDVEGHEAEVITGGMHTLSNSKVIILEIDKINQSDINSRLSKINHFPAFSNGINMIFVHRDHTIPKINELPENYINLLKK